MRLLFLNHNVAWRAGFFRAYHWGRYLARKGHHVTLLTISESRRCGFEIQDCHGIRLVKTPDLLSGRLRSGWDPWDTLNRILRVAGERFDLVHSVDTRPVCILPALMLQKLQKATLILDWLDWWGRGGIIAERSNNLAERLFAPVETFFEEGFRQFADGSVVISSALKSRALALGVGADHLVQIPFGADVEGIKPRERIGARHRLGLNHHKRFLGYVGNINHKERQLMIDAFSIINRIDERTRLVLIGRCGIQPTDIPPDICERVIFTGAISYDALQDYIAACDAMLLPLKDTITNRGRFPSKLSDYLAAGRPVVACAVGDLQDLFLNSAIGALCKDEAEGFAQATLQLLTRPDLDDMGRNARRVAEKELAWDLLTDRLESFYGEVMRHS